MAVEALIFKGTGKGARRQLAISVPRNMTLNELLEGLRTRLAESQGFFRGTPVTLHGRPLLEEERRQVAELVAEFGMVLQEPDEPIVEIKGESSGADGASREPAGGDGFDDEAVMKAMAKEGPPDDQTLLVRRTLRSGQRIFYDGHVVIVGDVNPGAMVTCSGDIVVMGRLRGVAHAGAGGNVGARVMAFRLQPTQLRIAHYISRAPDDGDAGPGWPEAARVNNGVIEIHAFTP